MTTHQDTNTERNCRVQERYDELMQAGKHGHYESMFRVVREEVDAALSSRDEAAQQPQGPSAEDVRELSKWLNEEVSAPINRQALARVLAVQQPQGQAVSDERVEELAAQFDISVSAVRAILSLRDKSVVKESLTTERVPLSDGRKQRDQFKRKRQPQE